MDAPETSKLAMYKFEDVGLFYIQLTRPDQLEQPCSMLNDMSNVNDGLAFIISNFVISTPESFYIRNFIKFLLKLQISTTNFTQLRELKQLYTQMVYSLKNKLVLKSQKKFGSSLNEFISHDPERIENEDPENVYDNVGLPVDDESDFLSDHFLLKLCRQSCLMPVWELRPKQPDNEILNHKIDSEIEFWRPPEKISRTNLLQDSGLMLELTEKSECLTPENENENLGTWGAAISMMLPMTSAEMTGGLQTHPVPQMLQHNQEVTSIPALPENNIQMNDIQTSNIQVHQECELPSPSTPTQGESQIKVIDLSSDEDYKVEETTVSDKNWKRNFPPPINQKLCLSPEIVQTEDYLTLDDTYYFNDVIINSYF